MEHKDGLGSRLQIRKIKNIFLFPSLFSKLFTIYLSILIITFTIFFVMFSNAFKTYFVSYTQDIMIKQAQNIANEYAKLEIAIHTDVVLEKLRFKVEVLNSFLEGTTWLVDKNGNIYVVSENEKAPVAKTIPQKEIVQKVFDGKVVKIENGFKEYFDTPVITIGYPITIFGDVYYALFIHTPMPEILKTIDDVTNITLQVVSSTVVLVFIWIYLVSKQMTKPLKEMNIIAKKIASGQFDKRIEVKGRDEIAELAGSLNYMATELDKIEEKRKRFIGNISHDLRSPLTSIQGFVTAILDGTVPADQQEKYLKIVLNESKRMINMTNDILELSKMEQKDVPIHKFKFNLNTVIKECVDNFENKAKDKNVKIVLDLEEKQVYAFADRDMIIRVIQNLLDNSIKFVYDFGLIEIQTLVKHNKLWVYIKNNGPSIPEEEQKTIWDRFYKGDYSRSKDKSGLGLGLVIVKEIIHHHEETVGVTSKEGEMVKFYFSLEKG